MADVTTLLVSTDETLIDSVRGVVDSVSGLKLRSVADVDEAMEHLDRDDLGLLLVHMISDEDDVLQLVQELATLQKPVATIVVSDDERPKQFFSMLRQGVANCLARPLDLQFLTLRLDILTSQLRHEFAKQKEQAKAEATVESLGQTTTFLYDTGQMGPMMSQVQTVAPQDTTILLTGETGTGKTLLAHLVHDLSDRREKPFLVVNCGALAANLIESEMFGHVRGAFTDANRDRNGKFFDVGDGTLFLDEVDTLPMSAQVKLLRAVEERMFEPVGSNKSFPMKARIIAASNRHLQCEVEAGRFRQDLFYRLDVVSFRLPPLRERLELIQPLAEKFIEEFAARNNRPARRLSEETLEVFRCFDWPGNIRQLRNVIERAVALCPHEAIDCEQLPSQMLEGPESEEKRPQSPTLAETKGEAEVERITKALKNNGDNRLRAALELGISRVTLYKKLRKYGLLEK